MCERVRAERSKVKKYIYILVFICRLLISFGKVIEKEERRRKELSKMTLKL